MDFKKSVLSCFFICCFISSYNCNEPHCSKFHYEEALLEKLVRLEFKFEQMAKGYDEMAKLITEERKKLTEDRERMNEQMEKSLTESRAELDDMSERIGQTRDQVLKESQDLKSVVDAALQDSEAKLARISEDVSKSMNQSLVKLADLAKTPDVFFEAKVPTATSMSANHVVKFKTDVRNIGDGYNMGSGVFTVPIDGYYFFTAQFCVSGQHVYPSFMVDGEELKRMSIGSTTTACSTMNLLTRLRTGSQLSIVIIHSSNIFEDDYRQSSFSGILLKK